MAVSFFHETHASHANDRALLMEDLLLWRLLDDENADPAQLADLLSRLARRPLSQRVPYFSRMVWTLQHANPTLRAAAVRTLSGAYGPYAWRHLIAALDDCDPTVQMAAVEALRRSSTADAARFAHALFHRDPNVRRAAIMGDPPNSLAAHYWPYIVSPANDAEFSLSWLMTPGTPGSYWKVVLDLCAAGRLTRSQARHVLVRMHRFIEGIGQSSPAEQEAVVDLFFDEEADEEREAGGHVSLARRFFDEAIRLWGWNESERVAPSKPS